MKNKYDEKIHQKITAAYVPLKELILEDNGKEIDVIKYFTDYSRVLGSIELIIHSFISAHSETKDEEILSVLKEIRKNPLRESSLSEENALASAIMYGMSEELQRRKLAINEVHALLDWLIHEVEGRLEKGESYITMLKRFFKGGIKNKKNLIDELKKHLPFDVLATKELQETLIKNGVNIKLGERLNVEDVFDSKDYGGILCTIPYEKQVFVVSLTHLKIEKSHQLSRKIIEYQNKRLNQLKIESVKIRPKKDRYYFFLNPYTDAAFTKCPECNRKTKIRKFPLVILFEKTKIIFNLNKICKFCPYCELIIAKKDEIKPIIEQMGQKSDDMFVCGTLDKEDFKYVQDNQQNCNMMKMAYPFKNVWNFRVEPAGWIIGKNNMK